MGYQAAATAESGAVGILGIIIVVTLVIFVALGFIPANIAKKKGIALVYIGCSDSFSLFLH